MPSRSGSADVFRYVQQRMLISRCSVGSSIPFVAPDVWIFSWLAVPCLLFVFLLVFFSFDYLTDVSNSSSKLESSTKIMSSFCIPVKGVIRISMINKKARISCKFLIDVDIIGVNQKATM